MSLSYRARVLFREVWGLPQRSGCALSGLSFMFGHFISHLDLYKRAFNEDSFREAALEEVHLVVKVDSFLVMFSSFLFLIMILVVS